MTTAFIACHKNHLDLVRDRCAAELLNFFKQYKPNRKDGWLIITLEEIREKFLYQWGRDKIRWALNLLDELGFIERDHPRLNKRAWMYRFIPEKLDSGIHLRGDTTVVGNQTTVVGKPTTTIYKDPDQDPIFKEPEKMKFENNEDKEEDKEVVKVNSTAAEVSQESTRDNSDSCVKKIIPQRDPFFLKKIKPSELIWDWIPDGPWRVDGKLDNAFIDWHAKRWMTKGWGIDIHDARKNVRAYFKNDPTRLANDWQEYQEANAHKLANMALREQNGVQVSTEEKAEMTKHQNAFTANPYSITTPNTGELEKYKQWLDVTKPQPILTPATEPKRLEAEKEIDWDAIATQTDLWEQEQSSEINIPDGLDGGWQAYTNKPSEDDREFYRKKFEQRKQERELPEKTAGLSLSLGDIAQQVHELTEEKRKAMKEKARTDRKIAHWNNLLQTGIPSIAHEVRLQAERDGFQIVDNKIVEVEF